jgi:hypothetical protein
MHMSEHFLSVVREQCRLFCCWLDLGVQLCRAHFRPFAQLGKEGALKLSTVKHFVLDECDKMLEKLGELVALWGRMGKKVCLCETWIVLISCDQHKQ